MLGIKMNHIQQPLCEGIHENVSAWIPARASPQQICYEPSFCLVFLPSQEHKTGKDQPGYKFLRTFARVMPIEAGITVTPLCLYLVVFGQFHPKYFQDRRLQMSTPLTLGSQSLLCYFNERTHYQGP